MNNFNRARRVPGHLLKMLPNKSRLKLSSTPADKGASGLPRLCFFDQNTSVSVGRAEYFSGDRRAAGQLRAAQPDWHQRIVGGGAGALRFSHLNTCSAVADGGRGGAAKHLGLRAQMANA